MPKSRVHRFIARDFTFRAAFVDATQVIREMREMQGAKPIPTRALGRALMGSLLMASHLKDKQSVGVYIRGDSDLQSVFAEASFDGQVRAYTPQVEYEGESDPGFGKGYISVQRDAPFQKQPYHGTVELLTGDVQDDIMFYLKQSQQIRCLIELEVRFTADGNDIEAASGLLIEVMPGVESEVFNQIVSQSSGLDPVIDQVIGGRSADEIVGPFFRDMEFVEIDHPYPIVYNCRCTRERVRTTLAMLGAEEMQTILDEGKPIDVRCQICGKPYHFSLEQVSELLSQMDPDSMH